MSILLLRGRAGTGAAPPEPTLDVPTIHARIDFRDDGFSWIDAFSNTDWVIGGTAISGPASSLATSPSDSFGGGTALMMVTDGTATSGIDCAVPGTAVSGREYRFRVALRSVSGSTSTVLRAGNAADYASSTATITTGWAWYTVDWTPSGDRTDAWVSLQNGAAATQTTRLDHAEFYEKFDEVTLDSLRVGRGSRFDGARERPGSITLGILDPDEDYTPRNTASSLYGLAQPGRRVHVRGVRDGRLYAIAYGIITEVTPQPDKRTVSIRCTDGLGELDHYDVRREFTTALSYHQARADALADEALAATSHSLATDSVEATRFADGTDAEEKLLDYLELLNEATGTVHYCKPHVQAVRPWRYTTITRCELTRSEAGTTIDDDFQRVKDPSIRDESFITRQRVSWLGYEKRPSQVVVQATAARPYWTYTDDEYGSSADPEPEYVYRLRRRTWWDPGEQMKYPRNITSKKRRKRVRKRVGKSWVDAVVPISLADGESKDVVIDFKCPMQDMSADVTDTNGYVSSSLTAEPARLTITLSCSGGADEVTAISVTATPHIPLDEEEEEASASGATVTHEGSAIDNETIISGGQALGLAEYWTWRYGDARLRPTITDQHHMDRQLALDVGSHVTLSADRWHVDSDRYVVRSIEHDVSGGGLEWETSLGLEELPAVGGDWLTLDGTTAQGLDGSAVLAY